MDYQLTPLGRQIGVFAREAVGVSYRLTAELITPVATYPVMMVTQLHTIRNFEKAVGDEVYIDVKFPPFQYQNDILPYQQQLKLRLIVTAYATLRSKADQVDETPRAYVYRAVCLSTFDTNLGNSNELSAVEGKRIDLEKTRDIQFQLFDPVLESFMQSETGDNYYGSTVDNILGIEFGKILQGVESDTGFKMRGVDIAKPQNQDPVKLLMIPHGQSAIDLVDTVQNQVGIYTTDVGCYYQSPFMYIYPLYDEERYENAQKVAVFYNYPTDKFPGIEKTWIKRPNFVEIACTRSSVAVDTSNTQQLLGGTGGRFTSASNLSKGMTDTKDGETLISRTMNNSEYVTNERSDGVKLAKGAGTVTDNRYRELSKTAARRGRTLVMAWEHANIDLLYPNIPSKVLWIEQSQLREAKGGVLQAEATITMAGSSFKEPQWNCHGSVTLWLGPKEKDVIRPLS